MRGGYPTALKSRPPENVQTRSSNGFAPKSLITSAPAKIPR